MDPLEVILQEARDGVAGQAAQVDELRSRVGTLLAAASLALAVTAAALGEDGLGPAGVVALVLFGVAAAGLVIVLLPIYGWRLTINAREMLATLKSDGPDEFIEMVIKQKRDDLERNRTLLGQLYFAFAAAGVLLAAGAILLAIDVTGER